MAEYKDTLNLPHTEFPMKASLPNREPVMQKHWDDKQVYEKIRDLKKGKKTFILHDGPPYANGHLHCGHALNKILKDIIVKSKTLADYDAPYVPGWDCHGLPIELNVEKKIGKAGVKVSHTEFRKKCREYADSQIDIQRDEFKRLGVFGAWEKPYTTMDFKYEANIVRALAKIVANGHIEQGFKPVHWCIDCGSALAEAEVDYEDKVSDSIDVAFVIKNPEAVLAKVADNLAHKPVILPIWTTTPWTLPANEAVALHPEITYALVEANNAYYILARELVDEVLNRYGFSKFIVHREFAGKLLEHTKLVHPLFETLVPVVLGEHVNTESGTGCVHTAPAHGPDDYAIGKKYNLPLINPVLGNGCYSDEVPLFAGTHVFKANALVIEKLKETEKLLHHNKISHSYPHCWRHKTPMIFRATPQWFVSMDKAKLRDNLLKQIENVSWIPDWGKARISLMVSNRPDWCISRQRSWGTPIPFFVHKTTRQLHPNTVEILEEVARQFENRGIDVWFDLKTEELIKDEPHMYEKVGDTLDVWFDSGVSHYTVLGLEFGLKFPADLYLEGSDQHRGWFNSALTTSVAMNGVPPFKEVLTHGYTVDAKGKKLSKSKGNYVALDKLIAQHGADILRLWVASTDYKQEVSISDEIIKRTADAYRRIRNTVRFLLANLFDFDPDKHIVPVEKMVLLDKWAIARCQALQQEAEKAYDEYQFHNIYQKLHNFCAIDMGSFYLDIIKDRQYTTPVNSIARRSCQSAMYHIVESLTRILAPILSYTADEIWQYIPGARKESVFLETWYANWPELDNLDMGFWAKLQEIRDAINRKLEAKRKEGAIGSALAANVTIYADGEIRDLLDKLEDELRFVFITSTAIVKPIAEKPSGLSLENDLQIAIDVHASNAKKCNRCWHRREDVGSNSAYPDICNRCADNITGNEEERMWA